MEEINGAVTEIGPGVTKRSHDRSVTTYSYIEVEDLMFKKVKADVAIAGKLQQAFLEETPVTLWIESNYLVGIKMKNGKTFGADMESDLMLYSLLVIGVVLGFPLLFVMGLGIPFLYIAWWSLQRLQAKSVAQSLPDVILI